MDSTLNATVAILGCGAMGTALLEGWLRKTPALYFNLHVNSERSLVRLQDRIALLDDEKKNIRVAASGSECLLNVSASAEIIVLACPPGELDSVVSQPGLLEVIQGKTMVSVLAGVSSSKIREAIAASWASQVSYEMRTIRLARVMPSLGASKGESVTLVADNTNNLSPDTRIDALFSQLGTIMHLPEIHMNRATALGAVCHALAIIATDTAGDASAAEGLPRPIAKELAAKYFRSCGGLMDQGMSPEQIKDAMAVPRGITINAVLNLEKGSRSNIAGAVRDAIQYAERMA